MFHRRADRLKMVLGENARITGDVESTGAIFIDGAIRGNVEGAKVILGEHGCVDGDIKAGTIIIGGTVTGRLDGAEKVEIKATGRVAGDIETKVLVIAAGGVFNGNVRMEGAGNSSGECGDGKVVEFLVKEQP